MNEKRAKITFWITVISFIGSILFVINLLVFGARSPECKECIEKMLYYQHRADSLESMINIKDKKQ